MSGCIGGLLSRALLGSLQQRCCFLMTSFFSRACKSNGQPPPQSRLQLIRRYSILSACQERSGRHRAGNGAEVVESGPSLSDLESGKAPCDKQSLKYEVALSSPAGTDRFLCVLFSFISPSPSLRHPKKHPSSKQLKTDHNFSVSGWGVAVVWRGVATGKRRNFRQKMERKWSQCTESHQRPWAMGLPLPQCF